MQKIWIKWKEKYTRLVAKITMLAITDRGKATEIAAQIKKYSSRIEHFLNYIRIKLKKEIQFLMTILFSIEKIFEKNLTWRAEEQIMRRFFLFTHLSDHHLFFFRWIYQQILFKSRIILSMHRHMLHSPATLFILFNFSTSVHWSVFSFRPYYFFFE